MAADNSAKRSRERQPEAEEHVSPDSPEIDTGGASGATGDPEPAHADEPAVEMVRDEAGGDTESELAACRERVLRLQAEMENLRRRTAREIADERRYAAMPIARDLLDVLDNVDRAVEAGEKTPDAASLLEGFRMVGRQLRSLLEKHGVKPIAAEGESFDPNFHEAILQQPSSEPSGTVVMVTKGGYQLHDRVVRPSQVIVSSGSPEEVRQ